MRAAAPDPTLALPQDADALRALLLAAWAERDGLTAERDSIASERDALVEQNERLRHLLLRLKRLQFGAKSERLPEEPRARLGRRSATRGCVRHVRPSAGRAAARCQRSCRGWR
jgi:hypothetical protein